MKILVVKEGRGPLTGELAAGVLDGHEPCLVATATAAVEALEHEAFDAVLLAGPLTVADRQLLAACLRADSALGRLPLVAMPAPRERVESVA